MDPNAQTFSFDAPLPAGGGIVEAIGPNGDRFELNLTPTQVHTPQDLSNFLAGYSPAAFRADDAIKPVPVDNSEFYYRVFSGDDAFLKVDTEIGLTSPPVNVDPASTATKGTTANHSVGSFVPVQTEDNASWSVKSIAGKRCMNAIMLSREIKVFTLLGTNTSWASGVRYTLGATENWDGGSTSDPIKDIQNAVEGSAQPVTGIWFNELVSNVFLRHDAVRDHMRQMLGDKGPQSNNTATDYMIPGLPPFHVVRSKYRSTSGGALSYTLPNHCVLVTAPEGVPTDAEEVSSAYNFREKGEQGVGVNVSEWFVQGRGVKGATMVNVTLAEKPIMVGTDSGGHIASVAS